MKRDFPSPLIPVYALNQGLGKFSKEGASGTPLNPLTQFGNPDVRLLDGVAYEIIRATFHRYSA